MLRATNPVPHGPRLPAEDTAQHPPTLPREHLLTLYLGHAPPLRLLKHLADTPSTGDQPGSHSGSCVSQALHSLGLVAKGTLLPGPILLYVSPPGEHTFRAPEGVRFQEKEHRKLSLPMADGSLAVSLGLLAAAKHVWHRLLKKAYRQALSGLYIVELFTRKDLPCYPRMSLPGAVCRQTRCSLRRTTLDAP